MLEAGGRRSGLGGAEDPHDPQTVTGQPPQPTCTHGVVMLAETAGGVELRSLVREGAAGYWNVTNGLGCYCDNGCERSRGVQGRHPR